MPLPRISRRERITLQSTLQRTRWPWKRRELKRRIDSLQMDCAHPADGLQHFTALGDYPFAECHDCGRIIST
jgi:hypothetical protein